MKQGKTEVVELAQALIDIPSVSADSNQEVIAFCTDWATQHSLETERLTYVDEAGVEKHCLVARAGSGSGGLGFFTHTDTVPGLEGWEPFASEVRNGRLLGRGSCDMKGPIAAVLCALAEVGLQNLKQPVYVTFSADEEVGHVGATHIIEHSCLLQEASIRHGIVTEPTRMVPVYAHKGGAFMAVHAQGKAAHSSTEQGESSNFRIAPFLAEMAALKQTFLQDPLYRNDEFDPPTNGFNMTITDFGCATNVTADHTMSCLSVRNMPDSGYDEAVAYIEERAAAFELALTKKEIPYFYGQQESTFAALLCHISGERRAVTVPYGTEASHYSEVTDVLVWGPGDIAQAHTVGEFIDLSQLRQGQAMYRAAIEALCL